MHRLYEGEVCHGQFRNQKVKCKIVPVLLTEHRSMKAYWWSGGIAPRILDRGTTWRWVIGFMFWPLYSPGGRAPGTHYIGGWVGPEPVWTPWWRQKFPAPAGTRTPNPARSPAIYRWAILATYIIKSAVTNLRLVCHTSVVENQRAHMLNVPLSRLYGQAPSWFFDSDDPSTILNTSNHSCMVRCGNTWSAYSSDSARWISAPLTT
jgi:hypothetical protein